MGRLKAPARRKQLIDVATRLFAERGFDATTTAGIATAAGVSEPILYRHFRSKQDLFIAIVTQVTQTTQEHWRTVLGPVDDPAEAFRLICREWPEHLKTCRMEYGVIHNALVSSRDPDVLCVLRNHYDQMFAFFTLLIDEGKRRGLFNEADTFTVVRWILFAGIGYTLHGLTLGVPDRYSVPLAVELNLRAIAREPHEIKLPTVDNTLSSKPQDDIATATTGSA